MPCYISSVVHLVLTASPDCILLPCAGFNLMLFYTLQCPSIRTITKLPNGAFHFSERIPVIKGHMTVHQ